jgi:hypothetical protein
LIIIERLSPASRTGFMNLDRRLDVTTIEPGRGKFADADGPDDGDLGLRVGEAQRRETR